MRLSSTLAAFVFAALTAALAAPASAQEDIQREGDAVYKKGVRVAGASTIYHDMKNWNSDTYDWDEVSGSEMWYTRDGGRSWQLAMGIDDRAARLTRWTADRKSSHFTFHAPMDGLYGFYFVRGSGGERPLENQTTPNKFVYIDTVGPAITQTEPKEGSVFTLGEEIVFRYEASDDTPLVDGALSLAYRRQGNEEWTTVIENAVNDGEVSWLPDTKTFPEPTTIDVRISITDALAFGSEKRIEEHTGTATIHSLIVGNYVYKAPQDVRTDKPTISVAGPDYGKILYEKTDFFYEVQNNTGSPLKAVVLHYSMDGGATWQVGGLNDTGEREGHVTVHFAEGFRRHGIFGNYSRIDFYYQAITEDARTNAPDPMPGTGAMAAFPVDIGSPLLHLVTPARGDILYRDPIPHNEDSGKYTITWNSFDNNLVEFSDERGHESGPVKLWYTQNPGMPDAVWTLLADRLPARGSFTRKNDLPLGALQVKVTSLDQMGNISERLSGVFEVKRGSGWEPARPMTPGSDYRSLWREANAASASEQYDVAREKYESAIELAPAAEKDSIRRDSGASEYLAGNTSSAMEILTAIVDRNPANLNFRYDLAVLHYRLGQSPEAKMHLREITRLDDANPHFKARALLANILLGEGKATESYEEWKYIHDKSSPTSDEHAEARGQMAKAKARMNTK